MTQRIYFERQSLMVSDLSSKYFILSEKKKKKNKRDVVFML